MAPRRSPQSFVSTPESISTFFENASTTPSIDRREETSNTSPTSSPRRGKQNTLQHPRLKQVFHQAKQQAAYHYDLEEHQKQSTASAASTAGPAKTMSKRQRSNIRSAVICRNARAIYLKCLEEEIKHEEQCQLAITDQLFKQTEQNCALQERIRALERRIESLNGNNSWLTNTQPSTNYSNDRRGPQFFLENNMWTMPPQVHALDQPSQLELVLDEALSDSEAETADIDIQRHMDFQTCSSSSTHMEECSSASGSQEYVHVQDFRLKGSAEEQTSPVTILDTAPQVPHVPLLAPSLVYATRAV